jgi:hypothetical protein
MKRIINASLSLPVLLSSAQHAFAQSINIETPNNVIAPTTGLGAVIGVLVGFMVTIAVLAALIYIILGAFQWITSGGDKAKVESARNHIIAAVVGLVIIALSFVILNIVTNLLGIGGLANLEIKGLQ